MVANTRPNVAAVTLRALPRRWHILPAPPTPLVGRDAEVTEASGLLLRPDVRLVTFTGPGGVGKTRLALAAAAMLAPEFTDGVVFVALAGIHDADLVPAAIAQPLGIRAVEGRPLMLAVQDAIRHADLLLVLDNFEHVLSAAPLIAELLAAAEYLKVLATSRAPLRLRGEREIPALPLEVQGSRFQVQGEAPSPLEPGTLNLELEPPAAVRLFAERARDVRAEFALTAESAPVITEICRRLDGLPLAIELAAARSKLLSPDALLARLGPPPPASLAALDLLTGGARDMPGRHQAMRDTIAWSYNLLAPAEQALFRRLAVFSGGCTVAAATALAAPLPSAPSPAGPAPAGAAQRGVAGENENLTLVTTLLDHSLLRRMDAPDREPRVTMLETIREYAAEQLAAGGETEATRRDHALYHLAFAERLAPRLRSVEAPRWMDRLAVEQDNLRAALGWAIEHGEAEIALRLVGALYWFWMLRGDPGEGRAWAARALAIKSRGAAPAELLHAWALHAAGRLADAQGDKRAGRPLLQESAAIFRRLGNAVGLATALTSTALMVWPENPDEGVALSEEAVAIFRTTSDRWGLASALNVAGLAAGVRQAPEAARVSLEESLALCRGIGESWGMAEVLANLALLEQRLGATTTAMAHYRESLRLFREIGANVQSAMVLAGIGLVQLINRDLAAAAASLSESLDISRRLGAMSSAATGLEVAAAIIFYAGNPASAVRSFAAAGAIREANGVAVAAIHRGLHDASIAMMRAALGDAAFDTAWAEGAGLNPTAALDAAIEALETPASPTASTPAAVRPRPVAADAATPHDLTRRELEVLRLLVGGHSNPEMAATLVLSVKTIERHLFNIYTKIDVRGRVEAVTWALDHGIR